ncbi:MAG: phosphoglycerate dehydrogenase [Oligoflexia bacterium]|nr:phosphoglycerate dehydrogenase [Oligoflexia bacterium]
MFKVLVTTHPFAEYNLQPIEILQHHGCEVIRNSQKAKFSRTELINMIKNADALIAGVEKLDQPLLEHAPKLKIIARVGIGLDNVDFDYTNAKGIKVTYTPDAPSRSVAELTMGMIIDLARYLTFADQQIKLGKWQRYTGVILEGKTLGIVGLGRIGRLVAQLAAPFGMKILTHDILPNHSFINSNNLILVSKEEIIANSDFLTMHIPLYSKTINYLDYQQLSAMRHGSFLINTSRGGIINELALAEVMRSGHLRGAALDVFCEEPYNLQKNSLLAQFPNMIFSAHMGSCTREGRYLMEYGAAKSIVDIITGKKPEHLVTEAGY